MSRIAPPDPSALIPVLQGAAEEMDDGLTGFTGLVADIIVALGELGVGTLVLIETVFPPIPSEVILSLAGWQAQMGRMDLALTILAATAGGVLGALVLYGLGAWFGEERAKSLMARLPLIDREDLDAASGFFLRHGRKIVFFGRFVPIVRSLVSIPAGAQHMPLVPFVVLTALGSGLWNALLVGAGYALGTQYHLLEGYLDYVDYVVYAAILLFVGWYLIRWHRKHRAA